MTLHGGFPALDQLTNTILFQDFLCDSFILVFTSLNKVFLYFGGIDKQCGAACIERCWKWKKMEEKCYDQYILYEIYFNKSYREKRNVTFSLSFISFLSLVAYCFNAGQIDLIKINIIFYHLDYNVHCTLNPRVYQYLEGQP